VHTESYFNPKAKSHAPAYGLMQLVPTSGGRAAYRYVYKKDKVLPPSYFYVPEQNVELGCAYLHFLRTNWFKKVKDDEKATYCIVASYNTGAGNLSRAIRGDTKVYKAIPEINKLSAEGLYEKLRKDLPYEETREYIRRVRERTELYVEWRQ
jgi:membrane-bound lytic murein transglycosylase C